LLLFEHSCHWPLLLLRTHDVTFPATADVKDHGMSSVADACF
jgi:hypothetical protein